MIYSFRKCQSPWGSHIDMVCVPAFWSAFFMNLSTAKPKLLKTPLVKALELKACKPLWYFHRGQLDIPKVHDSNFQMDLIMKGFIPKGYYTKVFEFMISKGHYSEDFYSEGSLFQILE